MRTRPTTQSLLFPITQPIRVSGMSRVGSCTLPFLQKLPIIALRQEGSSPIDPTSRKKPSSRSVFSTSDIVKRPENVKRAVTSIPLLLLQRSPRPNEVLQQEPFVGVEVVFLLRAPRGRSRVEGSGWADLTLRGGQAVGFSLSCRNFLVSSCVFVRSEFDHSFSLRVPPPFSVSRLSWLVGGD